MAPKGVQGLHDHVAVTVQRVHMLLRSYDLHGACRTCLVLSCRQLQLVHGYGADSQRGKRRGLHVVAINRHAQRMSVAQVRLVHIDDADSTRVSRRGMHVFAINRHAWGLCDSAAAGARCGR